MLLLTWNLNNLGNQDRSLSADAIAASPTCGVTGSLTACAGGPNQTYGATTDATSPTYAWALINNTSGASIVESSTGSTVTVNPSTGGSYQVQVTVTANNISTTWVSDPVLVCAAPVFSTPPANTTVACGAIPAPSNLSYYNNVGCNLSGSDLSTQTAAPGACGGVVTETWTYTDNCNRTITNNCYSYNYCVTCCGTNLQQCAW